MQLRNGISRSHFESSSCVFLCFYVSIFGAKAIIDLLLWTFKFIELKSAAPTALANASIDLTSNGCHVQLMKQSVDDMSICSLLFWFDDVEVMLKPLERDMLISWEFVPFSYGFPWNHSNRTSQWLFSIFILNLVWLNAGV